MSSSLLTELQIPHFNTPFDYNRNLTPQYTWSSDFRLETERLKTFENWPLDWLDRNSLAATGMFYTGVQDHTKCYFCEVIIGKWDHGDDPVQEHLKWSPNCPLLQRRLTDNMPVNEKNLDLLLPPVEQIAYDTPPSLTAKSMPLRDFSIRNVRLQSFADWPRSLKQKPAELAEAGFYYKGCGDSVVCFSCLAGLKDWEEEDDPWEQHALWMGHFCPYVQLVKGNDYVKSVQHKFGNNRPMESKQNHHEPEIEVQKTKLASSSCADDKLCKICFEKECNTAYVPCGHVVACGVCALAARECPVCRSAIKNVQRLYFA